MERINVEFAAKLSGNTLSGVAHVYGKMTKRAGRYETFARSAFDRALRDPNTDAVATFNHSMSMILGRQSAGTLTLTGEEDGLHFSIDLPDTTYAQDLKALVERGDVNAASFGFAPDGNPVAKFSMSKAPDGTPIRTWTDVGELVDVSPVSMPAFQGTSLQLHSQQEGESARSQAVRIRLGQIAKHARVEITT